MKIIYIANSRIPTEKAHGYTICKMCAEFAQAGHNVELWIPSRRNEIKEEVFTYYSLPKIFRINEIKTFDFIGAKTRYGRGIFILETVNFLIKLLFTKVLKESIIYTRNPEVVWLFKLRNAKVIYESHSAMSRKNLFELFIHKADRIIALTKYLKEVLVKIGISENIILIAPDAVDMKIFDLNISRDEAREKLNLAKDKIILGYTGNFKTMGQDKGIDIIMESLQLVRDKKSNILFMAVGGQADDIFQYEEKAKKLGIDKNIILLPRVNLADLAIYQKACDILLMPFPNTRHYSFYMSPLKMFEYMAARQPIIASDLPSIREVLNDNNCFIVSPNDAKLLAEVIIYIIDNPELARQKAEQAYRDVQEYTWKKRSEKIINFIS